jgi:opacity protein-like surface antigen
MKKNIIIIAAILLLAASLLTAQTPAKGGAADFIKYLEDNKETLQYEKVDQKQKEDKILVTIYCSLETQKKLLDILDQFAVLEFRIEMAGVNRVVATTVFQGEAIVKTGHGFSLKNKIKTGVAGVYYYAMDKNIDGLYGRLFGGSVDFAYRFVPKADFWLSAAYVTRSATPDWTTETLKLTLFPFSGAFRYHIMEKGKWDVYLGAGVNYYLIREINPVEDIKTTALGFCALGGSYFKLSPKLSAQAMLKYNMISKDVYPNITEDNKLDLGGLELRLGVAFSF